LDTAVLALLSRGDRASSLEILRDFLATTQADLSELRQAEARGDRVELARYAHRIKGASRMVGARPMAEAAQALEDQARDPNGGPVAETLAILESVLTRLDRFAAQEFEGS
jgi:HPt (histidine-containing phosphotransfer) domain-containing protein